MLRSFFKNAVIYALQPFLSKLLLFALVPLYTRYLSTGAYGNVEYALTIAAFYAAIIDLGLSNAFWNFRLEEHQQGEGKVLFNVLVATVAMGLLLLVPYLLASWVFPFDQTLTLWLVLLFSSEILKKFYDTSLMLYTAHDKPYHFLWGGLWYAMLITGLNIWFLAYRHLGETGVVYAYVSGAVLSGLIFLPYLYKKSSFHFDGTLIRKMVAYGLPIMTGNLALVFLLLSSRFFLKTYVGDDALGQFVFANKWGTLAQVLLLNAFYTAWNPLRWQISERTDAKAQFSRFYRVFVLLLPLMGFALMAGVYLLVPRITYDQNFLQGMYLLPFIVMAYVFFAFYYFDSMAFLFKQQTKFVWYIMLGTAAVNVVLNVWLVPAYQISGAAWAFLGSYAVMMLLTRLLSNRFYRIERSTVHDVLSLLVLLALTIGVSLASKAFSNTIAVWAALGAILVWIMLNLCLGKLQWAVVKALLNVRASSINE